MQTHVYTPKFDGIFYDGKQLPGRDPETGRFVGSTPDIHDPAWHEEPTHLVHKSNYIPLEEIPVEMGIGFETTQDCEARVYGESTDDPYVDEYDMYFSEREYYGFANGKEYHDKYDMLAERHGVSDDEDNFTTVDDYVAYEEIVVCSLNGVEITPGDAEDVFYGMIFAENVDSLGYFVPGFYGVNRTKVGQIGWWDIDNKDHKTWMNRRRSTGLSRAPKWQQFAGGRKPARRSIKTLPIEEVPMDFSEVLDAHDAVM